MIKSMTGFGRGEASGRVGRFTAEIRSVNHRYFDVSSRTPNSIAILEDRIKRYLHRYIRRGKVNFSLSYRSGAKDFESVKLDDKRIAKYYRMLNKIKKKLHLDDDIKLSHILSFPDVIIQEEARHEVNLMWPVLEESVKEAVVNCNRMREKEGTAIYRDLTKRVARISKEIEGISRMVPREISEYKRKLDSKIEEIIKCRHVDVDRGRLETELAIFARQCDVSEEITRVKSHLAAFQEAIESSDEVGRRLDFILQELQREINTLGSKTGAVKISALVVDIKSEIEKMREQVQNVE